MEKKQDRNSKKVYTAPVVVRRKPLNHVASGYSQMSQRLPPTDKPRDSKY